MRIVQSFWSSNKDLTQNSFGWLSPQHHLMGWTLSCLLLNEHYDDLHLYTDSNTKRLLIDYLQLPYKEVHTDYDDINHYQECLYALPKILTYAAQNEPFIHVDGDVFIFEKFDHALESAEIVAQNYETGTAFNNAIIKSLKDDILFVPEYLSQELNSDSHAAYNAGILGGSDTKFMKYYAQQALDFINKNCDKVYQNKVPANFNIISEQILFHALIVKENRTVSCYYTRTYNDHGYTIGDFADFTEVPYRLKYLHLIGAHKRNGYLCDLMARTLFKNYPKHFYKIISLFKEQHTRSDQQLRSYLSQPSVFDLRKLQRSGEDAHYSRTRRLALKDNNTEIATEREVALYVDNCQSPILNEVYCFDKQLKDMVESWSELPIENLKAIELAALNSYDFFFKDKEQQLETFIQRNENMVVIEDSFEWTSDIKRSIIESLPEESIENFGLAVVPQLFFKGYSEVLIDTIDYNILAILNAPIQLKHLLPYLEGSFAINEEDNEDQSIYHLTLIKLKYLLMYRCIFIQPMDQNLT